MAPRGGAAAFAAPFRIPPERRSTRQAANTTANTSPHALALPNYDVTNYEPQRMKNGTKEAQHPTLDDDDEENAYIQWYTAEVEGQGEHEEDNSDSCEEDTEDDGTTFKSRPKLPQSVIRTMKLGDLIDLFGTRWLDLNPEYQRDVVWKLQSMSGLINSLIEDYYIPPIIFNLEIHVEDGSERWKRICVDGKQRLSSIKAFVAGEIPCTDKYGKKWYYKNDCDKDGAQTSRVRRRVLSNDIRVAFRNKSLTCYEYKNLTPDQEEDLFARVQKGMQLKPAEKIRATTGPWQALAKQFENDFKVVVNLAANDRSSGFRHMLSSFSQILETQNPSNANGLPSFKVAIKEIESMCHKNKNACNEATKSHLSRVFTIFRDLAMASPNTFRNNNYKIARKFAPMELIATAVLISKYCDSRNNELLLGDIRHMRDSIRQALPDLRLDSLTWRTVSQYIYELESYRGATDGSNIAKKTFHTEGRFARTTNPTPAPVSTNETPQPALNRNVSGTSVPCLDNGNESVFDAAPHPPVAPMVTSNRNSQISLSYRSSIKPEPPELNFQPGFTHTFTHPFDSAVNKRKPGLEIGAAGAAARELALKRRKTLMMPGSPVLS